jgi:GntR family transcriptional regulator of arabinose operon
MTVLDEESRLRTREEVVRALIEYGTRVGVGGKLPRHTELTGLLGASERTVREALNQLQLEGRLIRRKGVGTFVADISPAPVKPLSQAIVAVSRPDRSFFDQCVSGLCRYGEEQQFSVLCKPVTHIEASISQLNQLFEGDPLGFVVFGYGLRDIAYGLSEMGARVVLLGVPPRHEIPQIACIHNDHKLGGFLVANHLIELGHRRIASWAPLEGRDIRRSLRWTGYERSIREAQSRGVDVEWSSLGAESVCEALLSPDGPTALVAWNDYEAAHLYSLLREKSIRVPDDVSVVGYDDLPEGELVYPPLTTVRHGMEWQVELAADLILSSDPVPRMVGVIAPELVVRSSCGPPRPAAARF